MEPMNISGLFDRLGIKVVECVCNLTVIFAIPTPNRIHKSLKTQHARLLVETFLGERTKVRDLIS